MFAKVSGAALTESSVFTSKQKFRHMSYRQAAWIMRTLKTSEHATEITVNDTERAKAIMRLQTQRMIEAVWHYINLCGAECPHRQPSSEVEHDAAALLSYMFAADKLHVVDRDVVISSGWSGRN